MRSFSVFFTNSLGLFSLKDSIGRPEARAFPVALCWKQWWVFREHVVISLHATHTWPRQYTTGQRARVLPEEVQKWKYQITWFQIPNIYLENKILCRQLLISSVIMGNGTDQWLKCQIKCHLCCVAWKYQILTVCVRECFRVREMATSLNRVIIALFQSQVSCFGACLLLSKAALQLSLNFINDCFGTS